MTTSSGFNPTRRSRKIGTAAQGHGQDNRHVIPDVCTAGRVWSEQLSSFQLIEREVKGQKLQFFVEKNHGGCEHHCSVDDICHILGALPVTDWVAVKAFVFRQSTKTQRVLKPAWGRMYYHADLGIAGRAPKYLGPAIMIEAQDCSKPLKWNKSLSVDRQQELERLIDDGHKVDSSGRHYVMSLTSGSVRATQLYRTLLHEIGHWVDFTQKVEEPNARGNHAFDELFDDYFRRPSDEREAFAHRYADEVRSRLTSSGVVPFQKIE